MSEDDSGGIQLQGSPDDNFGVDASAIDRTSSGSPKGN